MLSSKQPVFLLVSLFAGGICGVAQAAEDATLSQAAPNVQSGSDPLFIYQWHLRNRGQKVIGDVTPLAGVDLRMGVLHELGFRGKNVIVGVVDDGLEIRHEDLSGNVVPNGSKNFVNGSNDPTPSVDTDEHGTSVAGIIAEMGWNGIGGRGIAPEAKLKGFNFLASDADSTSQDANILYAWGSGKESRDVAVFNNSWGSSTPYYPAFSTSEQAAWERLMQSTRSGKGGVYIKSAGNSFKEFFSYTPFGRVNICSKKAAELNVTCASSTVDPNNNLITIITAAAVNVRGLRSSYSTAGSSVWISGFGGEFGNQKAYNPDLTNVREAIRPTYYSPAIVTTDLMGCSRGANTASSSSNALEGNQSPIDKSCNYWARMNGTSSAAPTVSGVVSLMLGANPKLTQRDVKYILASTARPLDPYQPVVSYGGTVIEPGWITNAAGHHFSNWYGFGLVDATAAVNKAMSFNLLPAMKDTQWKASNDSASTIGDVNAPATLKVRINQNIKVEAVQLSFQTSHMKPSNLKAVLTSPSGTKSYVMTPFSTLSDITSGTGFTVSLAASNAFLDEPATGDWTLSLTDVVDAQGNAAKLQAFKLRVVGH
ncbi:serine protease [Pseudomonas asuensis]|uniref:Serine protease n=1 Tax=Pseudomonas asuensis TaxID=1825787 RepID=A0ABQ2GXR9_9PSED|nr:S8 family serine peptidase [Pseudomonas asuensis]GGM17325.1 serine protease [Pseudomonas asuensis]